MSRVAALGLMLLTAACAPPVAPGAAPPAEFKALSAASGPATMCGLTGADANDLAAQIRTSKALAEGPGGGDQFDVYESVDEDYPTYQWLITRRSHPAHPTVTCRSLYLKDGATMMLREMRCNADEASCDRLSRELQQLDDQARQYVRDRAG